MVTLLEKIQQMLVERAYMMTAICPINTEVSEGETVLGEVPAELRPLCQLRYDLNEEATDSMSQMMIWRLQHRKFDSNKLEGADPDLIAEYQEKLLAIKTSHSLASLVNDLFWHSLKDALPDLHNYDAITLRSKWRVVASDKAGAEGLIEVLNVFGLTLG